MTMKKRWKGIRGLDGDLDPNPTTQVRLRRVLDELLENSAVTTLKAISKGRADPLFGYEGRVLSYLTASNGWWICGICGDKESKFYGCQNCINLCLKHKVGIELWGGAAIPHPK